MAIDKTPGQGVPGGPGPLDRPGRIDPKTQTPNAKTDAEKVGPKFDELLEAVRRMRIEGKGAVESPEEAALGIDKEVSKADAAHKTAMDLKRQLEAAFKRAIGEGEG